MLARKCGKRSCNLKENPCRCEDMNAAMSKALVITLTLSSIYFNKLRQVRRIQFIKAIKNAAMGQSAMEQTMSAILAQHGMGGGAHRGGAQNGHHTYKVVNGNEEEQGEEEVPGNEEEVPA
ncbi:hypothetical protein Ciccas_010174 [Cichlidogyrus casuarinus]|uniref:Uncharacterized protein n=1 Tax=Cichlidogyrus casuarinus TaxID=1844966 RepID=A0ABD2PVX9_9PLAT